MSVFFFLEIRQLLTIRPIYKRQVDFYDKTLKCVTHLIYLMIKTAITHEQRQTAAHLISNLVKQDPRSVSSEDTLLHLCASKSNTIRSTYVAEEDTIVRNLSLYFVNNHWASTIFRLFFPNLV